MRFRELGLQYSRVRYSLMLVVLRTLRSLKTLANYLQPKISLKKSLKLKVKYLGGLGIEAFSRGGVGSVEVEAMNLSEEHEAPKQSDYISLYDSIVDRKPVKQGADVGLSGEEYIVSLGEDKVFALAPAAYYIWNLCDGLRSVGDILEKVKSDLKESGEEGLEEVELKQILAMVLSELNSVGLISWT